MDGDYRERKSGSVSKTEYGRDYKRLKLQEEFLEKNLSSAIKGLKIDADFIRQLSEDRVKVGAQRETKLREIGESVIAAFGELKSLRSILEKSDTLAIQNLDVRDFGSRLTKLSNKIEDFKGKSDLEFLSREEESLDYDLREFERGIFLTELKTVQPISKNAGSARMYRKCPTRSEVNDQFTELVARTGHTQGWSDEDHSLFLKTRSKFASIPRVVIEMRKKRPHMTNEEIVNHEAWYKLFTELREKRKREIAEWRSKNRNNEIIPVSCGVERAYETKTAINRRGVNGDRKKTMIEEWRAERSRKSAMDEEQRIRLEKARTEEEKRRRNAKRCEARIKMMNHRDERAKSFGDEEISTLRTRVMDERQTNRDSRRLLKSFRERDEKFVRKRLSRSEVPKKLFDKMESVIKERGYSTLLKPTKVWEERCKRDTITDKPEDLFGRVNYVKDIQRL